jgi:hypothetical protein
MRLYNSCGHHSFGYEKMLVEPRTIAAVAITLVAVKYGLGRDLPFDIHDLPSLVIGITLFIGYLYLTRTLFRLPFALTITYRRMKYARQHYSLNRREALRDGFYRGFLDRRRWSVTPLALYDRLALLTFTLMATTPLLGALLVGIGGIMGLVAMLVIYLYSGTFNFLLGEAVEQRHATTPLPYLELGDR